LFNVNYFFKNIDNIWEIFHENLEGYSDILYVWDVLKRINEGYIKNTVKPEILGDVSKGAFIGKDVYIGKGTSVEHGAYIEGPTIIGENCTIRHGAYIRGHVIMGDNSIAGHASEIIRSLLLPGAKAPHFNYVGDSLLGHGINLGAGTILSNLKNVKGNVVINYEGKKYETGLKKFGAILGDRCQTGCNSVLNPGTIIGPDSIVYPTTSVRGVFPEKTIIKLRQEIERAELLA